KHQAPSTKHQAPDTKHQAPSTNPCIHMTSDALIILLSRAPGETEIKTRLARCCSESQRRQLLYAFVVDTLGTLRRVKEQTSADFWLCLSSPWPKNGVFSGELPTFALPDWLDEAEILPQVDGDLGHRQAQAIHQALEQGYRRVIIIGSDSPTLPAAYVTDALSKLTQTDMVVGPSEDGGYYLIGFQNNQTTCLREQIHPFLSNLPWSTDQIVFSVAKRAQSFGFNLRFLPEHYDVDTCSDLKVMWKELSANPGAASETWQVVQALFEQQVQRRRGIRSKHC
ncbi:MAG TPA: TIGR04282 family arsenosugar biosynthesis glycosyltransferase, partial [Acidobacteriota bacterium]|nr:TIGR04282 family arsenosugar biosynthesis glycosyltransferase [Acidobacteriota bacterium]